MKYEMFKGDLYFANTDEEFVNDWISMCKCDIPQDILEHEDGIVKHLVQTGVFGNWVLDPSVVSSVVDWEDLDMFHITFEYEDQKQIYQFCNLECNNDDFI